jgi:hypothetical protein
VKQLLTDDVVFIFWDVAFISWECLGPKRYEGSEGDHEIVNFTCYSQSF